MADIPTGKLPPPPGTYSPAGAGLTLPTLGEFRFPYPRPYKEEIDPEHLLRDYLALEERIDAIVTHNALADSFRLRVPFRYPTGSEEIYRNFYEIEDKITAIQRRCCSTCFLKIPFPHPYQSQNLSPWQFTRDLFEIEAAVNGIQTCSGARNIFQYRQQTSLFGPVIVNLSLFDPVAGTGPFGGKTISGASSHPGGFNADKSKCLHYRSDGSGQRLYTATIVDLSNNATWTEDALSYAFGTGLQTLDQIGFLPSDGRYICLRFKDTSMPSIQLKFIDGSTMTDYGMLSYFDIYGTGTTVNVDTHVFSPDGRWLAIMFSNGTLDVWNRVTGANVHHQTGLTPDGGLTFSEDGEWFARSGGGGTNLRDTATWSVQTSLLGNPQLKPYISDDNAYLFIAAASGADNAGWHMYDLTNFTAGWFDRGAFGMPSPGSGGSGDWIQGDSSFFMTLFDTGSSGGGGTFTRKTTPTNFTDVGGFGNRLSFVRIRPFFRGGLL